MSDSHSVCNSKQCNVRDGIQILCSFLAMYPQTFLPGILKAGIVSFDFGLFCEVVVMIGVESTVMNDESIKPSLVRFLTCVIRFLSISS